MYKVLDLSTGECTGMYINGVFTELEYKTKREARTHIALFGFLSLGKKKKCFYEIIKSEQPSNLL